MASTRHETENQGYTKGVTGAAAGGAIDYGAHEPELRRDYEARAGKGSRGWDEVSPAYRYGWESHDRPEYRDKSWSQVITGLKKGWTGSGDFADHEPHVRNAWERRASLSMGSRREAVDRPISDAEGVLGAAVGSTAGVLLGSMMGGLVGGPVGVLAGGVAGTLAGAGVGYWVDYNPHEDEFRQHHESDPTRVRHPFEQASPAYRYGWESRQRPEFRDKTYAQVRPELHKGWTGSGDFADYESYVEHAWDRLEASHKAGSFSQAAKE